MIEALRANVEEVESTNVLGNPNLPIAAHRAEIEMAISQNSVVILVGPTGSGKTTQVPQIALEMRDHGYEGFDQIIATQTRIVAARTLSERVNEEIITSGQQFAVGFYTSKERTLAPQRVQHIAFLTEGKVAAQLLHQPKQPKLPELTQLLIIDEVHEWNKPTDTLVAIATEKTDPASPHYDPRFKVVIMSATMDSERVQKHFAHASPVLITVEVPTYQVTRDESNRAVADVAVEEAVKSRGKVLAFLPGKREIKKVATVAEIKQAKAKRAVPVIPLHGQQTAAQQRRAFKEYSGGAVIATTNAAETSLTVPGAVAVIDSGEVRTNRIRYDLLPDGSEGLYLEEASQANLDQRAGRVGRTGPGRYILCSPDGKAPVVPYEDRPAYATPAMQRSRIGSELLQLAATEHDITDFRFFNQPPKQAVTAAQNRLFTLGAITETGAVTARGLRMDTLPLDIEYACMIAFSHEQPYSDEVKANVLDIAAIMQLGGILKRAPKEQRWRDLLAKDRFDDVKEADSDFIAQLEAYIKLTTSIPKSKWGSYDILEHAAGLVEVGRQNLADRLGLTLHTPTEVAPENREAVLTCINAGQLNQLWRRHDDNWSLALGKSEQYQLSESSLVGPLGNLATGTLFSLGLRDRVIHSIQNVNRVMSPESLDRAAQHLVAQVVDQTTARYIPARERVVVRVKSQLGDIILKSFDRPVDTADGIPEVAMIQEGYAEHAWGTWEEHTKPRPTYDLAKVTVAINNPESKVYGVDPISGDILTAWRGGNGQWCRSKEIALASLTARRQHLIRAPQQAQLRTLKADIRVAETALVGLKRNGHSEAARLLSQKKKTTKLAWLGAARDLLSTMGAAG